MSITTLPQLPRDIIGFITSYLTNCEISILQILSRRLYRHIVAIQLLPSYWRQRSQMFFAIRLENLIMDTATVVNWKAFYQDLVSTKDVPYSVGKYLPLESIKSWYELQTEGWIFEAVLGGIIESDRLDVYRKFKSVSECSINTELQVMLVTSGGWTIVSQLIPALQYQLKNSKNWLKLSLIAIQSSDISRHLLCQSIRRIHLPNRY